MVKDFYLYISLHIIEVHWTFLYNIIYNCKSVQTQQICDTLYLRYNLLSTSIKYFLRTLEEQYYVRNRCAIFQIFRL